MIEKWTERWTYKTDAMQWRPMRPRVGQVSQTRTYAAFGRPGLAAAMAGESRSTVSRIVMVSACLLGIMSMQTYQGRLVG